jgi:hypothetical protein
MVKPNPTLPQILVVASCLAEETNEQELSIPDGNMMVHYNARQKESYSNIQVNPELPENKRKQVWKLLEEFQDIFTDVPKVTHLDEHEIRLLNPELVQRKPYPVPAHLIPVLDKEIDEMLAMNIISPSSGFYSSPLVMIKKPDGSQRVCVDFRYLNRVCALDPEASYSADDIFNKLGGCNTYSKFDFSKGYYQIPLQNQSKELTTFACHRGKFKFEVLPFGLSSAPMTFNRVMRKLLAGSKGLHNYLDDVLAHSGDWNEHMMILRDFFSRVRAANLSLKPSKCQIGYQNIEFLGQVVIEDALIPNKKNLEKILESARPETKTQVKSFLGCIGFYKQYIARFSEISSPLTDLLKKAQPNRVHWGKLQEEAFQNLKAYLLKGPVLKLPMLDKEFILRTDACNVAVGAVLLQKHEGVLHPVAYASKKLSPREALYPISEKECLGIIFGVQRFHKYLFATRFKIQTDHKPLEILGSGTSSNPRLMRWALALQPYQFVTEVIPGVDNVGADFFSRHFTSDLEDGKGPVWMAKPCLTI